jgi:hypothetical protein
MKTEWQGVDTDLIPPSPNVSGLAVPNDFACRDRLSTALFLQVFRNHDDELTSKPRRS